MFSLPTVIKYVSRHSRVAQPLEKDIPLPPSNACTHTHTHTHTHLNLFLDRSNGAPYPHL